MDEIPVPDKGNILVQHEIGEKKIPFFRHIDQYPPYASVNFYIIELNLEERY